jgi:hypothetical protein
MAFGLRRSAGVHVVSREAGEGRTEDDFIERNRVSE